MCMVGHGIRLGKRRRKGHTHVPGGQPIEADDEASAAELLLAVALNRAVSVVPLAEFTATWNAKHVMRREGVIAARCSVFCSMRGS